MTLPRLPTLATPGRLLVVSNRVALPGQEMAGGMAPALSCALHARGGVWLGWSGQTSDEGAVREVQAHGIRFKTWDLNQADVQAYYTEFANRTLWPLLHGRTDLMDFDSQALLGYLRVNEKFADHICAELQPGDTLWVHDYHLLPLASLLRARGVTARIGFFLHTPLPAPRTLVTLPHHRTLLGMLSAYDVVGVQTRADAQACRTYFEQELGARFHGDEAQVEEGHRVVVRAFPIGVAPKELQAQAEQAIVDPQMTTIQASLGQGPVLIGVDRLDYAKGLPQRLRAFGKLLEEVAPAIQPTLLQISPESRRDVEEYRQLSRQVERLVGDINGHHASLTWTPVRYVNQNYPHAVLTGLYRMSRVGLVTPLRDGMNLVAKEYLACQNPDDPGVLVLSEFAGAAEDLKESALLVNPYDIKGTARTLQHALAMPRMLRQKRWETAWAKLNTGNLHHWCQDFLDVLATNTQAPPPSGWTAPSLPPRLWEAA